ncbi:hypothetical protein EV217_2865 [Phyllobacterium myrsinacearum]|uniref:baseplate hub protein n=1 Tax=Phyllobacterium myrsinacearum TaxID=28101 RepID=UPI001028C019|nr:hypothetical protein [Phyllobacterium myrsinacearum]RZS82052.1 hypothetical protein EV217_2865 [Phyllobacterium myrsinacearum]
MSFTQKRIDVQLNLANGQFQGGGNTVTVSGLRVSFTGTFVGGQEQGTAEISIYGLSLSLMNQMSTVGTQKNLVGKNHIAVLAGDAETTMSVVFEGTIFSAFVDAQAMPDVAFRIYAKPGLYHAVVPATPISVRGSANAADLMKDIAGKMGLSFENAGVTAKLANPYFAGTLWTQAQKIAQHGGFDWTVDRGTLAIVQPGKTRDGDPILISPETGMISYPAFNSASIIVAALFNPNVKHYGKIEVRSDLTPACGIWTVSRVALELESMIPNGRWFMILDAVPTSAPAGTP